MKKILVTAVASLALFSACSSESTEPDIYEQLDASWSEMTAEDRVAFCLGYHVLPSEDFFAGAADRFGEDQAADAVTWAEQTCD